MNQQNRPTGTSSLRAAEILLGLVSLVLLWRVVSLRRDVAALTSQASISASTSTRELAVSRQEIRDLWRVLKYSRLDSTVEMRGLTKGGSSAWNLSTTKLPLVIFTFDHHCASCTKNLPIVQHLRESASCKLELLGLSLNDKTLAQWSSDSIGFNMVETATGPAWDALPLSTPSRLILFGPGGKLVKWWTGLYEGEQEADILREITAICA
jgi:hypothetical protein